MHSRLDIAHVVDTFARLSSNPRETNLSIVKRIFIYQKGTKDYGLWYKQDDEFNLKVYIDVDWARNIDDRKMNNWLSFLFKRK